MQNSLVKEMHILLCFPSTSTAFLAGIYVMLDVAAKIPILTCLIKLQLFCYSSAVLVSPSLAHMYTHVHTRHTHTHMYTHTHTLYVC